MFYHYASVNEGRLSYRRSLQLSKENIEHLKTRNLLKPTKINSDLCRSGSVATTLLSDKFGNSAVQKLTVKSSGLKFFSKMDICCRKKGRTNQRRSWLWWQRLAGAWTEYPYRPKDSPFRKSSYLFTSFTHCVDITVCLMHINVLWYLYYKTQEIN